MSSRIGGSRTRGPSDVVETPPLAIGSPPLAAVVSTELTPVGTGDHVLGFGTPYLTLIEYGDFGCPFCFAAKLPVSSLLERYKTLELVWRHFPDPELHPGDGAAAQRSRSSGLACLPAQPTTSAMSEPGIEQASPPSR